MRSRCAGFMLAWILKMKPEKFGSVGSTTWPASSWRACGGREYSRNLARKDSTPKLFIADPKNMGVSSPARTLSRSNSSPATSSSSRSSSSFSR